MQYRTLIPAVAAPLLLAAAAAAAQTPYSGCVDRLGRTVVTRDDNTMAAGGMATIVADTPVIYWNAHNLGPASESARTFIYLHECAHHRLGHLWKQNDPRWEREADCWAIQHMVEGGAMKGRHVVALEEELKNWPGDALHLGGTELVRSLQDCIDVKTDRRRWLAALDLFAQAARDSFASIRGNVIYGLSPPTYETTADVPGTYDCEIRDGAVVVCPLFDGRKAADVARRFREISTILRSWTDTSWTVLDRDRPGDADPLQLHAMSHATGAQISLIATAANRLFLILQPADR